MREKMRRANFLVDGTSGIHENVLNHSLIFLDLCIPWSQDIFISGKMSRGIKFVSSCQISRFHQESEPPIDLRQIQRMSLVDEKSDKYGPRLHIDVNGSVIRLRFSSAEDANIWKTGLDEWKKYASDHGMFTSI